MRLSLTDIPTACCACSRVLPHRPHTRMTDRWATQKADLWSFGAFIAQIVTGHPIFKGGSDYMTFKRVLKKR